MREVMGTEINPEISINPKIPYLFLILTILLREAEKIESDLYLDAIYNLAGNLVTQQRYDEARAKYEEILTLEPGHQLAEEWIVDLDEREELLADS
mgnify:CR=1 FL=1